MNEQTIISYFKDSPSAEKVEQVLKQQNLAHEIQIDQFSKYPGSSGAEELMSPLTGKLSSLSGMTLGLHNTSGDVGVLAAVDVSAGGMSDGGMGSVQGYNYVLTVITSEDNYEKARDLIEEGGGLI